MVGRKCENKLNIEFLEKIMQNKFESLYLKPKGKDESLPSLEKIFKSIIDVAMRS